MQAYWTPIKKTWAVRYKAARIIFDHFDSLIMRDCIFRGYNITVKGHPTALIEGKLDLKNISTPDGTPIILEDGKPPVFRWDGKDPLTVSQMIGTVWLNPDKTIVGRDLGDVPNHTGVRGPTNRFANEWECEWYRGGALMKKTRVTAIHQWNAVRYLLRIRQTQRRYGILDQNILTYDDTKGNVVIVRPVEKTI